MVSAMRIGLKNHNVEKRECGTPPETFYGDYRAPSEAPDLKMTDLKK
jgi:hypothetical protein